MTERWVSRLVPRRYRILRYALPYWPYTLAALALMAVFSLASNSRALMAIPFLKNVVEIASNAGDMGGIFGVVIVVGALGVVMGVFGAAAEYMTRYIACRIDLDIRNDLCDHLLTMSLRFFSERRTGELVSRLTNDIATAQRAMQILFQEVLLQPLQLAGAVFLAFYLSWRLSLVLFVLLPVLSAPLLYFRRKILRIGVQRLGLLADLTDATAQIFSGIRIIKAFQMEDIKRGEFRALNRGVMRKTLKQIKAKVLSNNFSITMSNLTIAAVLLVGGYLVIHDSPLIPPASDVNIPIFSRFFKSAADLPQNRAGTLLAFLVILGFMYQPFKALVKAYNELQDAFSGAERVLDVFAIKPDIVDEPNAPALPAIKEHIAFRNVDFGYNEELVLHEIDLRVPAGETVAVVGHSGAGKSTLLDLIPRFHDPINGCIEIDGVDIRTVTRESLLKQIAVVGQDPFLFNASVLDNIRASRRDATAEEVIAAAKAANIHEFVQGLPKGYGTVVGERGARLSGGERQRITIARALLRNAPILLLDEAVSSLDNESERLVLEALSRLMETRTTFVIAHRLSTVQHADRIIVLRHGRLVEQGTHDELIAKGGEYCRLYRLEFSPGQAADEAAS